jgi:hypothetical protein
VLDWLVRQVPEGHPLRGRVNRFVAGRFAGGFAALAKGRVQATGQPHVEFDPRQIDSLLAGFPVAAMLTRRQFRLAARVLAGLPHARLDGVKGKLRLVQRNRLDWWVGRVRAAAGWADQAIRYRSGARPADLTVQRRGKLVRDLLSAGASADERWLALELLRVAHDADLAVMFAGGLLAVLDAAIPPGHALRGELEQLLAGRFAAGWEGAARGDAPHGLPAGRFTAALLGPGLDDIDETAKPAGDEVTRAARAIGRAGDDLASRFLGLPPIEQLRATQWLISVRVATDAQAAAVLAKLDDLLTRLLVGDLQAVLDAGIPPGHPLRGELEQLPADRLAARWAGTARRDGPRGHAAGEFSAALLGLDLDGVDVITPTAGDEVTLAAEAIGRAGDELVRKFLGLAPAEQLGAAQWLISLRAAMAAQDPALAKLALHRQAVRGRRGLQDQAATGLSQ